MASKLSSSFTRSARPLTKFVWSFSSADWRSASSSFSRAVSLKRSDVSSMSEYGVLADDLVVPREPDAGSLVRHRHPVHDAQRRLQKRLQPVDVLEPVSRGARREQMHAHFRVEV